MKNLLLAALLLFSQISILEAKPRAKNEFGPVIGWNFPKNLSLSVRYLFVCSSNFGIQAESGVSTDPDNHFFSKIGFQTVLSKDVYEYTTLMGGFRSSGENNQISIDLGVGYKRGRCKTELGVLIPFFEVTERDCGEGGYVSPRLSVNLFYLFRH